MKFLGNKDLQIAILLFLLSCIFFWKVFIYPEKMIFTEYFSDVISQFSPYKSFIQETWNTYKQFPLWSPYIFMGHPFIGNPISAMFYPTNFLYLIFPVNLIFSYLFLLDIFLAGLFTYFFMKVLGLDRFSSLVSAIVFMFSWATISRVYAGHPPILDIISLMPLTFLLIEIAIQKRSFFYGVLAGIPLGLQFLAGQVEFAFYSSIGLSIYFLLRVLFIIKDEKSLKSSTRLIPIIFLTFIVGLLLSAVQSLPSFELSKYSARTGWGTYDFATSYSLPPQQLITFLIPEFFGTPLDDTYWGGRNFWELAVYMGVLPLILAFLSVLSKKNNYRIIFIIMAIFFLLLALGKYSPIFPILFHLFPLFKMFRMPAASLFLSIFSLSILSGFGSEILMRNIRSKLTEDKFRILTKILIILTILSSLTFLSVYFLKDQVISIGEKLLVEKYEEFTTNVHPLRYDLDYYILKIPKAYSHILKGSLAFIILLVVSTSALILGLKKKIQIKYFKVLILLIILSDLWFFGMNYIDVRNPRDIFSERIPLEIFKEDNSLFRFVDFSDSLPPYISMTNQIEGLQAHEAIQLKYYRNFILYFFYHEETFSGAEVFVPMDLNKTVNNPEILGLLNVKYLLTKTPIESDRFNLKFSLTSNEYNVYLPTSEIKTVYVYENKELLPRAFIVFNAKIIENDKIILQEMNSSMFNPKDYVILEKDINIPKTKGEKFKEAEIVYYSPNEIRVEVKLQYPGFLVLSENWYPGWKAYDNGLEKEIYKADYTLRSIYLDKGEHDIKFVYDPISFKVGSYITIITIFSLCGFIIYKLKIKGE